MRTIYKWYFVTKIVLQKFEITRTIYSDSERSEQFLVPGGFSHLINQKNQIGNWKNYWDLETSKEKLEKISMYIFEKL